MEKFCLHLDFSSLVNGAATRHLLRDGAGFGNCKSGPLDAFKRESGDRQRGPRPAGGTGFFNEIDANAYLEKKMHNGKSVIRLHPDPIKWRGDRFKPVRVELIEFDAPDLRDAKGQPIKSIMMEAWESAGIGFPDEPDDEPVTSISTSILTKSQKAILLRFRTSNSQYTFAALKAVSDMSDSTLTTALNVLIEQGYIAKLPGKKRYVSLPKATSKSK